MGAELLGWGFGRRGSEPWTFAPGKDSSLLYSVSISWATLLRHALSVNVLSSVQCGMSCRISGRGGSGSTTEMKGSGDSSTHPTSFA